MKFAHEFKDALEKGGFPEHWVESAIPYGQLKKCIKKVKRELEAFGLDSETLGHLSPKDVNSDESGSEIPTSPVAFRYKLAEELGEFRPTLTLYVRKDHEDEVALDATLSKETRSYLHALQALQKNNGHLVRRESLSSPDSEDALIADSLPRRESVISISSDAAHTEVRRIEVPLTFDAEFFGLIKNDILSLDEIQANEQKALTSEIEALGSEVSKLASPSKLGKTDLNRWREVFDLYLQAGVFFSTNEVDHGRRSSSMALKQLQWFQTQLVKFDLPNSFKLTKSQEALARFTQINMTLLRNLKFQEINQLAIKKILKKFDKRTALGAKQAFPPLIQSDPFMSEVMAKAVCAEVSNEIVKLVPQLDDYLCPVCCSISYRPIRLRCGHVFCVRCTVQMQKTRSKYCPLCRDDVVMTADNANVDKALKEFLKRYFPKETKTKQREDDIAAGVEIYGKAYADAKCILM